MFLLTSFAFILLFYLHSLERHELYVEMACNGLAGAGQGGVEIAPTDSNKSFKLEQAEIVTVNTDVETLLMDLEVLIGFTEVTLGLSCTDVLWGQSSNVEVN